MAGEKIDEKEFEKIKKAESWLTKTLKNLKRPSKWF